MVWYFWSDLIKIIVGVCKFIIILDYYLLDLKIVVGMGLGIILIVFLGLGIKVFILDFDNFFV